MSGRYRLIKIAKPDKKNSVAKHIVSSQYDATITRCPVMQAIEDGYFDTANANKSSVRVHGGQSSEFPIYPTTLERTIILQNVRLARKKWLICLHI